MDMPLKQLVCTVITVLFMFTLIGIIKNSDVFASIPAAAHTKADYNGYDNVYIKKDSKFKYENMALKDIAMPENNSAAIPVNMPEPSPIGTITPPANNPNASETLKTSYVVSKKEREYDGKSAYIDIRTVFQLPELPVGCEATSLTMALRYFGFDADKTDIAGNFLPKSDFSRTEDEKVYINSYYDFFLGDPFGWGYGCFSNCIVKTAENYISANGGGYDASCFAVASFQRYRCF